MKAVVFHGVGDLRLDTVKAPAIKDPNDAIVRITATAICGTDLHFVRGTMPGMVPGTVLGHEGIGIVEDAIIVATYHSSSVGSEVEPLTRRLSLRRTSQSFQPLRLTNRLTNVRMDGSK